MVENLEKLSLADLKKAAVELRRAIATCRFDKATGKLMDTSVSKKKRRELARVLTFQRKLEN